MGSSRDIERLLAEILKSTSKTTHAVRAFVRFLFIQLSASTLAVLFLYWSQPFSYHPIQFLAVSGIIIYLIGAVWASIAGWSELSQSE